jgi:hypothetical protein
MVAIVVAIVFALAFAFIGGNPYAEGKIHFSRVVSQSSSPPGGVIADFVSVLTLCVSLYR